MALIPAKCTQCGANIEVDDTKEAGICKYCGTAFITEKAINNYNITNNINASVVNIINNNPSSDFETDGHKLLDYKGNESIVNIPSHINEIGSKAFDGNLSVIEINIQGSVKIIGDDAFARCTNLVKVHLPDSLFSIGDSAFVYCQSLKEISIPDNVYAIGANAFSHCESLTRIELPQHLRVLRVNTFHDCYNLQEIILKNEIKTLESEIFCHSTNLKEIVIPSSVTKLDGYVFMYTNLDKVIFENANNIQKLEAPIFAKSEKIPEIDASDIFIKNNQKMLSTTDLNWGNNKTSNGCYIATCVYGSYDCPEVWTLRRFRDYTLDETWYGRLFIKCYYAVSPTIVNWFGNTDWFKTFWKKKLDKMVSDLNHKGIENTTYTDKY